MKFVRPQAMLSFWLSKLENNSKTQYESRKKSINKYTITFFEKLPLASIFPCLLKENRNKIYHRLNLKTRRVKTLSTFLFIYYYFFCK